MTRMGCWAVLLLGGASVSAADLPLRLRYRTPVEPGSQNRHTLLRSESWNPAQTAVIVCDVWDKHHSLNATRRGAELAPRIDRFVAKLRSQGATIVHAPSDCMAFYADHPARKRAESAPKAAAPPANVSDWCKRLPVETTVEYPIDQSDGGEDDDPAELARWAAQLTSHGRNPRAPWKSQIADIAVDPERDYVSDRGLEIFNVLESRRIRNVVLVGVHTNMCVLGRSFGLRRMVEQKRNVVLVRDLTDTMYNPKRAPYVDHHEGTDRIVAYIESHICPTIASDQVLGGKPFRFAADRRPHLVVVVSESEYRTAKTVPEFVAKHLGKTFRTSLVFGNAKEPNDLPGIEALADADVLLLSVRRRLLPPQQLQRFRDFVAAGKPVVGIRTASHAFAAGAKQTVPAGSAQWPEFDREVFGGNYHNHYGQNRQPTIEALPDRRASPLLRGLERPKFLAHGGLYKTSPLAAGAVVYLRGAISDVPPEPVAWSYDRPSGGRSFYTSLGSEGDFQIPEFRRLLFNALHWAAGIAPPDAM
jgi:nicotinamidase-related amidase/type 1 glutamine amidotransferase